MKIIDWCGKRPSKLILFERIRRFRYIVVFISINSAALIFIAVTKKWVNSHCEATNIFPDPLWHFRNSLFLLLHISLLYYIVYIINATVPAGNFPELPSVPCLCFACSLILKKLLPAPAPFFQKSNVRQRNQLMKHETKHYSTLFGKFL